MIVQAEVSLYALGEEDLAPCIDSFVRRLERPGLRIEVGPLSSLLTGESDLVFEALREAFQEVCRTGSRVLVAKLLHLHHESP